MGFITPPDGEPSIDVNALQSVKEPTSWTASFESVPPSVGFSSSRRVRLSDLSAVLFRF
jgi:hypothetical protein